MVSEGFDILSYIVGTYFNVTDASVNEDGFMVFKNNVHNAGPDMIAWLGNLRYTK